MSRLNLQRLSSRKRLSGLRRLTRRGRLAGQPTNEQPVVSETEPQARERPVPVLYYLAGQSIAATIRANVIVFFFAIDAVTLPWLWAQGLVSLSTLLAAAVTLPASVLGVWFGSRLFRLASDRIFRIIAFSIIAAVAVASALAG